MNNKKIFLDTSYLFPFFRLKPTIKGKKLDLSFFFLETEKVAFPIKYYFSPVSLIELKWLFIKMEKQEKEREKKEDIMKSFSIGINSLLNQDRFVVAPFWDSRINEISDLLRERGHTDYFDTLIGATSLVTACCLITEDKLLEKRIVEINDEKEINPNFEVFDLSLYRKWLLG